MLLISSHVYYDSVAFCPTDNKHNPFSIRVQNLLDCILLQPTTCRLTCCIAKSAQQPMAHTRGSTRL